MVMLVSDGWVGFGGGGRGDEGMSGCAGVWDV